ncbi:MAG: PhoH family protein [Candidatus Brocadiaceae bacterium]|nr:PhoH family protein [Candidatus Brocadiaceae bacterium]
MTKKIFVLDTSVILYDHNAIRSFAENDVVIPIQVLEELDNFKKGNETRNFEAREFIRFIDRVARDRMLQEWVPLGDGNKGRFRVVMKAYTNGVDAEKIFTGLKMDHKILNVALFLQHNYPDRKVILVSKDISLRLKAKSFNVWAEDYETGKSTDINHLYSGKTIREEVDPKIIDEICEHGHTDLRLPGEESVQNNQFFILKNGKKSALAYYNPFDGFLEKVEKRTISGIKPRNAEQIFAIHAILNSNIKLITLQGVAGTGKTLLAMAGALEQRQRYKQIFVTRPVVQLSNKDIGYLPGDIKEKLNPYLEPFWDNLKFIKNLSGKQERHYKGIDEMLEYYKIEIIPLTYIRGRNLSHMIFIVDEAQNLTPHEVKTIITRAGDNAKIIFTGDIRQIDTPYLDEQSNGLSFLIDRLKGQKLFAHINLEKGERSALANLANELL